jgi:hypothetical protein
VYAELIQYLARIGENVHQVRDGRALIAADVGHTGLQKGLGNSKYGLALEHLAGSEPERLNFARERPLCHDYALSVPDQPAILCRLRDFATIAI